ncbi:MAG TPA: ADP-ribosylation factor-like protein [Candidatus Deferrimicrobium sp.]|nr:ADP-ribosylation factor-like protein [Candidatus Deferrimicrobium sp.]
MKQFKVIFAGLGNAGKTSILKVLDRQFHKIANLVPTKGVERSLSTILGFSVSKWDLGGQSQYREQYLTTRIETLLEAEVILFVVDIQDNTYSEAVNYYKEILKIVKSHNENPYIIICLHKADPEVYDQYKQNINDLIKLFEEPSKDWNHKFYITSVYNRQSIIEAFSFGISQFLPKKKSIDLLLRNYIKSANEAGEKVSGVMLWDENSLFLNMIFDDKKTEQTSLTASTGILLTIESFEKDKTFQCLQLEVNREFQFYVQKVGELYTTIVGKQLDFEKAWKIYDDHYLTNLEEIIEEGK